MTHAPNEDLVEMLLTDHREVEEMFGKLEGLAGGTTDEAKTLAQQVVIELVRHSVVEEQYLYPTVREHVAGGGSLADQEIAEHAQAEKTMKDLEALEPSDSGFWPTVHSLMQEIRQHIREEELELFPRLRSSAPDGLLANLGEKARMAKKLAPTRPHPAAPDTPPMNKLLAPGTGLVDRARDVFSGRGKD